MATLQNFANIKSGKITASGKYLEGLNIDQTLYTIHDPLLDDVITALDTNFSELETRINGKMDNRSVIGATETIVAGSTAFVEAGAIYTALAAKTDDTSLANVAKSGNYSDLSNTPDLSIYATKGGTDLVNYYTKDETDDKIEEAVATINSFDYQVVSQLPTAGATEMYKIYLVPLQTADGNDNVYEEYMCVDKGESADPRYVFELIGTTRASFSGYVTETQLNNTLTSYVTKEGLTTTLSDYVTAAGLTTTLNNYQEKLTFDTTPTSGSTAPVTSGGVYTALSAKANDNAVVKTINGVAPTAGNITIEGASAPVLKSNGVSAGTTSNYYTWSVSSTTLSYLTNVEGQA